MPRVAVQTPRTVPEWLFHELRKCLVVKKKEMRVATLPWNLPSSLWARALSCLYVEDVKCPANRALKQAMAQITTLYCRSNRGMRRLGTHVHTVIVRCDSTADLDKLQIGEWKQLMIVVFRAALSEITSLRQWEKLKLSHLNEFSIETSDDLSLFVAEYAPFFVRRCLNRMIDQLMPDVGLRTAFEWGMCDTCDRLLSSADPSKALIAWALSLITGHRHAHDRILGKLIPRANINTRLKGITALGYAVLACDSTAVESLLDNGACPNTGVPPPLVLLARAARRPGQATPPWCHKITHIFELLLRAGADPNKRYDDKPIIHILLHAFTIKLAARQELAELPSFLVGGRRRS